MAGTSTERIGRRGFLRLAAVTAAVAATPPAARAQAPKRGGVLKHIGLEPSTFDIHAASDEAQLMSSFVRRTLFKFVNGARHGPSDFTLAPDLALRAEVGGDGRVYTIALRRGVTWEARPPVNGRELVASDVKYSMERALRTSPRADLLGPVESVETPDKYTVRVHLADAFAPFLHSLAEPWSAVLPPEVEGKTGDLKAIESLIGCGPFVLERYEPGIKAVFARNPGYYAKGLPYLDKIEWVFIRDRSTQLSLFRAGQVDIPFHDGRIPRTELASFGTSNPGYPVVFWDGLATRALAMRTDKAPFNDARVRRALSLGVDRRKWVAQHLGGQGFENNGAVPAAMHEWKLATKDLGAAARYLEHNPSLARKLLADAGFPRGLKVKCTRWPGYGPEHAEDLDLLASDLERVGVELSIVNEEHGTHVRGSLLGKYDETTWGPPSTFTEVDGYLYGFYKTGRPGNRSHVADSRLDVLLDAQRRDTAKSSRKKVIDEIQRHVAEQAYYIYTPYPRNVSSWAPRVRNYGPENSFDRGAQMEVVWIDRA